MSDGGELLLHGQASLRALKRELTLGQVLLHSPARVEVGEGEIGERKKEEGRRRKEEGEGGEAEENMGKRKGEIFKMRHK